MNRFLKSKRLWLALAIVLALAVALAVLWPKPPPQIITLPNGDQYEFAGTTYGTNLVPPSLLCHIADHLPARLHRLALRILGNRITWQDVPPQTFSTVNCPVLAVWFRQIKTNSLEPGLLAPIPPTMLADKDNFQAYEGGAGHGLGSFGGVIRSAGWFCQEYSVAPRRSPVLHLLMNGLSTTNLERITFSNPLFRTYPQWEPKDALPALREFPDLHVKIEPFAVDDGRTIGKKLNWERVNGVHFAQLSLPIESELDWTVSHDEIADATGNVLPFRAISAQSSPYIDNLIFSSLWPGERAWQLKIQLTNSTLRTTHTLELYVKPPY